jgi:hypothetical protein
MKDHYGGKRSTALDLVYFVTSYWSGGLADCVGGVRSPESAFAFGSLDYKLEGTVGIPTGTRCDPAHHSNARHHSEREAKSSGF